MDTLSLRMKDEELGKEVIDINLTTTFTGKHSIEKCSNKFIRY